MPDLMTTMTTYLAAVWDVLLELSPWLLLGAVISSVLHVALPEGFIERQLTGKAGVFKAVLFGVPLPLCSCGVIPAGLGLKRDGASDGAAVGFLISTPQTGVDSILVSASFLGWPFALFKVAAAFVTGLFGGLLSEAAGPDPALAAAAATKPAHGTAGHDHGSPWARMWEHGVDVLRSIWRWLAFGVLLSAALSAFLPPAFFATNSEMGAALVFVGVLALSVPLYVCATASVPIAAALVSAGMPLGAALVFLMAGPATNMATIGAVYRALGKKHLAIYLGTIVTGAVGFGLLFDTLLSGHAGHMAHQHDHTTWWAMAAAGLLLAATAVFAVQDVQTWLSSRAAAKARASAIEIPVHGMTCTGCSGRLQRVLQNTDGIETALVEFDTADVPGLVVVSGAAAEADVRAVIEKAGFEPG